jgi:hypothetical protein
LRGNRAHHVFTEPESGQLTPEAARILERTRPDTVLNQKTEGIDRHVRCHLKPRTKWRWNVANTDASGSSRSRRQQFSASKVVIRGCLYRRLVIDLLGHQNLHHLHRQIRWPASFGTRRPWCGGVYASCLVPCDHTPRRSWPLFCAKAMLDELIADLSRSASPLIRPAERSPS